MMKEDLMLELRGISKRFYGVRALEDVCFRARRAKVNVLIGENGAGKSTLMRILAGAETKDAGTILINGEAVEIGDPKDSFRHGISMIYQELNLVPDMSVAANIFLGREEARGLLINNQALHQEVRELFRRYRVDISPHTLISELSVAKRQMVEIMKSVSRNARIIVMDEPTSSLDQAEAEQLFEIIARLNAEGVTIIYISHKMEELFRIGDYVTVLRDGAYIGEWPISEIGQNQLVAQMVGRDITDLYPKRPVEQGEEVLRLEGVSKGGMFQNVSLSLHRGEILGFSGLVGAGRTELALAIFGANSIDSGTIYIKGRPRKISHPRQAIGLGVAYVPEDRKLQGVNLKSSIRSNLSLPVLDRLQKLCFIDFARERQYSAQKIHKLRIKTPDDTNNVETLSGGNQQKVALGKWIGNDLDILILDEPTRGVDVGAKQEIHRLIVELAGQGVGIILISSELPEVLGMSDRIAVMHEGRLTGTLTVDENTTQELIMSYSIGMNQARQPR